MAQLQHNMWVISAKLGGALDHHRWRQMGGDHDPCRPALPAPPADRREEILALRAERRAALACLVSKPPRPRLEAVRIVDMSASNAWAEFAATYLRTRAAHREHETAKTELKKLVPEDAKEATGHGIRAKRSKSGAVSFDPVQMEAGHAPVQ